VPQGDDKTLQDKGFFSYFGRKVRIKPVMQQRQHIRFCLSTDRTRIAVASIGSGPPLLRAAHWLSHVEFDLESPVWRPWLLALARHNTYVRYDQRGCGLSDREIGEFSLDAWVADLEAVVDSLGLKRFPLFGMSQGGAIAMTYAHRHPEKVSRLVLVGAYARGGLMRGGGEEDRLEAELLVNIIRVGWGRDNPAFREVFGYRFLPNGTPEQLRWWRDLERISATPEVAARTLEGFQRIDVTELAKELRLPVLVMHSRRDAAVPFEEGRLLAALIPGARFVPLESDNHVLMETEPAWSHFLAEFHAFLGREQAASGSLGLCDLTAAEADVLAHLVRGLDNRTIASRLGKSEKTVRNQVSAILSKLGVHTRAEAIVLAQERTTAR
jgi:pimeloyl-ACP methyl ester carboxylesterase/DNA-binding CsgD family transcriptional regulator